MTCSLCWRGSRSWRKRTFTWPGNTVISYHLHSRFVWRMSQEFALWSSLQSSLGLGHLPRLFSATMSCLLSPHTQVVTAAASTLKVGAASPGGLTAGFHFIALIFNTDMCFRRCWPNALALTWGRWAWSLLQPLQETPPMSVKYFGRFQWVVLLVCLFFFKDVRFTWMCVCVFQHCRRRAVLPLPCLLALCAADPGLFLSNCRQTSSSYDG